MLTDWNLYVLVVLAGLVPTVVGPVALPQGDLTKRDDHILLLPTTSGDRRLDLRPITRILARGLSTEGGPVGYCKQRSPHLVPLDRWKRDKRATRPGVAYGAQPGGRTGA